MLGMSRVVKACLLAALPGLLGAASCASAPQVAPASIEVVYVPGSMEYSIVDGGEAIVVGAEATRDFSFQATHEEFQHVAALLEPLKQTGLPCTQPPENYTPGYIVWHEGGKEVQRVEMFTLCYSDGGRDHAGNSNEAWRYMVATGRARYVAPAIPAPHAIRVEHLYWGNKLSEWTIDMNGHAAIEGEDSSASVEAKPEDFEEIRDAFRPYESRAFECERVIADLHYGDVVWLSEDGEVLQRTRFDEGCVSGDADDLFERIRRAENRIHALFE